MITHAPFLWGVKAHWLPSRKNSAWSRDLLAPALTTTSATLLLTRNRRTESTGPTSPRHRVFDLNQAEVLGWQQHVPLGRPDLAHSGK